MAVSFIKKGAASSEAAEQEKAATQKRKDQMGQAFRFRLKGGEDATAVMVDGELENGVLQPPRWYEHTVKHKGEWDHYMCPQENMPEEGHVCPICEGGDRAYLASGFTLIDTRPYTTKKGIIIPFARRLLVAKPLSMEMLTKIAKKRGGLAGLVIDISRSNDEVANIGDLWDVQDKQTIDFFKPKFMIDVIGKDGKPTGAKKTLFEPLDYDKEITPWTEDELRKQGFGVSGKVASGFNNTYTKPVKTEAQQEAEATSAVAEGDAPADYSDVL